MPASGRCGINLRGPRPFHNKPRSRYDRRRPHIPQVYGPSSRLLRLKEMRVQSFDRPAPYRQGPAAMAARSRGHLLQSRGRPQVMQPRAGNLVSRSRMQPQKSAPAKARSTVNTTRSDRLCLRPFGDSRIPGPTGRTSQNGALARKVMPRPFSGWFTRNSSAWSIMRGY